MKCPECRIPMELVTLSEPYHYVESGLQDVYLVGVKTARCPNDHETLSIPSIEGLHRAIAVDLARSERRLYPAEVRFLRKYIGLSSADLAALMDVQPETLSRWENGAVTMSVTSERLLRLMVVTHARVPDYSLDHVRKTAKRPARHCRRTVAWTPSTREWEPAA